MVVHLREKRRMQYFFLPELERYCGNTWEERASQGWMGRELLNEQSWLGFKLWFTGKLK